MRKIKVADLVEGDVLVTPYPGKVLKTHAEFNGQIRITVETPVLKAPSFSQRYWQTDSTSFFAYHDALVGVK